MTNSPPDPSTQQAGPTAAPLPVLDSAARALHLDRQNDAPRRTDQFRLMNYGILSKSLYLGRDGLWQERAEQAVIFTSWDAAICVGTCVSGVGGSWRVETLETFLLPMPI